jgi:hypothetical protein
VAATVADCPAALVKAVEHALSLEQLVPLTERVTVMLDDVSVGDDPVITLTVSV